MRKRDETDPKKIRVKKLKKLGIKTMKRVEKRHDKTTNTDIEFAVRWTTMNNRIQGIS